LRVARLPPTDLPDYELDKRRTHFPDLWTDVQGKSHRARLALPQPGSRQEARSRHAAYSPAEHDRRSVEPEWGLARDGRPHPAVELPVRRRRLLRRGAAAAPAQG